MNTRLGRSCAAMLGAAFLLSGTGLQEPIQPARPGPTEPGDTPGKASIEPARKETPPALLHRSWLKEVLDLDPIAAARGYSEVAGDTRPGHFARWVAAARLAELHRLDLAQSVPVDTTNVPSELRHHFEEADQTLEVHTLLRRLEGDPAKVLERLATEEGQLPELRPLVSAAEGWVLTEIGPTRAELYDRSRRRRSAYGSRTPYYDRLYAASVLRAELDGKRALAADRRAIHFTVWKPPAASADPAEDLRRFRINIRPLVDSREWSGRSSELHGNLRDEVERRAADNPADAIALLRRLPYYAERLLEPVASKEGASKEGASKEGASKEGASKEGDPPRDDR